MKWLIVVFMLGGTPETGFPIWSPTVIFDEEQECTTYVITFKDFLFQQSIKAYGYTVPPEKLGCMNEEDFKKLINPNGEVNDNKTKHSI